MALSRLLTGNVGTQTVPPLAHYNNTEEECMEIVTIINTQRDEKQLNRHFLIPEADEGEGFLYISILCNIRIRMRFTIQGTVSASLGID